MSGSRVAGPLVRRTVALIALASMVAALAVGASTSPASAASHSTGAPRGIGSTDPGTTGLAALPSLVAERTWIANGLKVSTLPRSLYGSVAHEDSLEFTSDPCAEEPGGASVAKACAFGDTHAKQTVVLYGNSYALEWIPAMSALGKLHHFKLVTFIRYGCPFADIATEDWLGSVDSGCLPFRANVVKAINALRPAPELVLLSESFDPTAPGGQSGSITKSQWVSADETTIKQLHATTFPVTVLLAMEHTQFDPGQCLAAHPSDVQACTTTASGDVFGNLDALEATGVSAVDAHSVDFSTLECTSRCPLIVRDLLVHADKAHIDAVFASAVAPALASLLGCVGTEIPTSALAADHIFAELLPTLRERSVVAACRLASSSAYSY
jgi:hypothetical protein